MPRAEVPETYDGAHSAIASAGGRARISSSRLSVWRRPARRSRNTSSRTTTACRFLQKLLLLRAQGARVFVAAHGFQLEVEAEKSVAHQKRLTLADDLSAEQGWGRTQVDEVHPPAERSTKPLGESPDLKQTHRFRRPHRHVHVSVMETLGGFPNFPAFRLSRAKPGFAIATRRPVIPASDRAEQVRQTHSCLALQPAFFTTIRSPTEHTEQSVASCSSHGGLAHCNGNPGRVPKPSREAPRPAKPAGSARVYLARHEVPGAARPMNKAGQSRLQPSHPLGNRHRPILPRRSPWNARRIDVKGEAEVRSTPMEAAFIGQATLDHDFGPKRRRAGALALESDP